MKKIVTQLVIEAKNKAGAILESITQSIKKTGDTATAQKGKLDGVSSDVTKLATADKKLLAEQRKLNISSEKLAISEKQLAAEFVKISKDAKNATTQEQKLRVQQSRLSAATKSLVNDEKRLAIQLKQTALNAKISAKEHGKLAGAQNRYSRSAEKAGKSSGVLGNSFGFINAKVAGLIATLGGLVGFSNVTQDFEALNAGLKTATGSSEKAQSAWSRLSDFADELGLKVVAVVGAFNKLSNLGLDPSEAALESYGNTAKALGKDLDQFIEAVADAATNEFERLKEFGIKAKQQADTVSFTFQGVTTTVGKNAKEIEGFLRGLGDVQFAGVLRGEADKFTANLNRIKNSFFQLAVDIGNSGASDAAGTVFSDISAVIKQTSGLIKANGADIRDTFNLLVGTVRFFGNAFIVVFNGIEIVAKILVKAMFGFAADINSALSAITFGETSEEFARNAQFMRETMSDLEKGIDDDASSIFKAFDSIGTSFDQPKVENNIQENLDNVKPEVDVLLRPDVQAAIASINSARDEAQNQVKPIVIPVVFDRQDSGQQFNADLDTAALQGGRR